MIPNPLLTLFGTDADTGTLELQHINQLKKLLSEPNKEGSGTANKRRQLTQYSIVPSTFTGTLRIWNSRTRYLMIPNSLLALLELRTEEL